MKFSFVTPESDKQISEILQKLRLSMNGIVSEQMILNGIEYKKNYGVSIPRLKEIAALYSPNHNLAQQLWNLEIRETMILALILEPVEKFTAENAIEWVQSFNQTEIVEQACMILFCKLPYANSLCKEWINSDKLWFQITGYILAARIFNNFNPIDIHEIMRASFLASNTTEFHLYKAVALCLSRLCRKDTETANYILTEINPFEKTSNPGQKYIFEEVKQEIIFLGLL